MGKNESLNWTPFFQVWMLFSGDFFGIKYLLRPKPDNRINKNHLTEYFLPYNWTIWPKMHYVLFFSHLVFYIVRSSGFGLLDQLAPCDQNKMNTKKSNLWSGCLDFHSSLCKYHCVITRNQKQLAILVKIDLCA